MDSSYIAHANIDHYLHLLTGQAHLTDGNRATIMKLLVAEEDKLGRDLEHLEFAEARTARTRDRLNYLSKLRDAFVEGSTERLQAEKVLANFQAIYDQMQHFCGQLRKKVSSSHV